MRCTLVVLDSLGVGAMPDAEAWGDAGSNTLGHVAQAVGGLDLPHLGRLGLGNITPVQGVPPAKKPVAGFGKAAIASDGKDTISGHWEMAGVPVDERFMEFPDGFPPEIVDAFVGEIGRGILGNVKASGTVILDELGEEHVATGKPIVYTSADSVFQVAAHEDVVDLDTLYDWCEDAYRIVSPYGVVRVIARPFVGEPGAWVRTGGRRDFARRPPKSTVVDILKGEGWTTTSIGKVKSIFGDRGFTDGIKAPHNAEITQALLDRLDHQHKGLIFANLVDFDMLYGHRRNPQGYADALVEFDKRVPAILDRMGRRDLLIFTADHGCDPTHAGTDHTREYVPILAWHRDGRGRDIGTRGTMADIGATIAHWFEAERPGAGESFLPRL